MTSKKLKGYRLDLYICSGLKQDSGMGKIGFVPKILPRKLGEKQSGAPSFGINVNLKNQVRVRPCDLYTHPKIVFI